MVNHALGRHTQCGLRYKDDIATKANCLVTDLFRCVYDFGWALHATRDIDVTNSSAR
jgi:hypothetical protein